MRLCMHRNLKRRFLPGLATVRGYITLAILPPPDQAKPVIWTYPLVSVITSADGRVITDFGPSSKWYQRDLSPRSSRGIE